MMKSCLCCCHLCVCVLWEGRVEIAQAEYNKLVLDCWIVLYRAALKFAKEDQTNSYKMTLEIISPNNRGIIVFSSFSFVPWRQSWVLAMTWTSFYRVLARFFSTIVFYCHLLPGIQRKWVDQSHLAIFVPKAELEFNSSLVPSPNQTGSQFLLYNWLILLT